MRLHTVRTGPAYSATDSRASVTGTHPDQTPSGSVVGPGLRRLMSAPESCYRLDRARAHGHEPVRVAWGTVHTRRHDNKPHCRAPCLTRTRIAPRRQHAERERKELRSAFRLRPTR